jgi:hypothetical protein
VVCVIVIVVLNEARCFETEKRDLKAIDSLFLNVIIQSLTFSLIYKQN